MLNGPNLNIAIQAKSRLLHYKRLIGNCNPLLIQNNNIYIYMSNLRDMQEDIEVNLDFVFFLFLSWRVIESDNLYIFIYVFTNSFNF